MKKRLSSIKEQPDNKRSSYYLRSKSKKADTVKIAANPMRNSQKMNSRYSSSKKIKIEAVDSNKINNNIKSTNIPVKNTSQNHIVITSVEIDYTKLLGEEKQKNEINKEKLDEEEKKEEKKDEEKKDDNKKDDDKDKKDNDQKKEEPQPSNPEVTKRIDSKIINELKHLELLDKWFEHKLNYKLLYRATEEQYSASIFHQKVDSYKNTIIFIKDINNFIYGGFTTKTWDGNKSYKSDKNAILFNLDKEKYYDVNDYSHAILCDKDLLAVFGDGDLILGPKSIESAFPKSFGNKDVKDNELTMGYNKLSPVEMEVFQLSY